MAVIAFLLVVPLLVVLWVTGSPPLDDPHDALATIRLAEDQSSQAARFSDSQPTRLPPSHFKCRRASTGA